jgi:carboxyl-terminal processing protease
MVPVLPIIDGQRTSRVQTSAATRHWLRSPLLRRVWSALLGFGWALVVINSQYLSSNSSGGVFHFKELVAAPAVALTDAQYVVAEAWHLVDRKYVDRVHIQKDWSKLRLKYLRRPYRTMEDAHAAIREMLGTLGDPYTRFLTPAQYSSLVAAARGEVVGIGVELAPPRIVASTDEDENHRITDTGPSTRGFASVAAVLEASPAARAGIRPDDEIMLVDGQDTTGLEPDDVAALIRGEAGSIVQLRVRHAGSADTKEITIKREPLRLDALSMHGPDGEGLGYVRIRQFNENTAEDLQAAVESMIRRNGGPLRLVVDLRGNPGGYFPDGIDAARLFLPQGQVVVYTHDAKGSVTEIRAREDGALVDTVQTPIWLLVDHGTASASEIFAVALHDNNRAKLIGACTFGKGLVQTVQGLRDGSAVAITTSRYETPKHQNINKKGVCPDIKAVCKAPSLGQDSTPIRAALDCLPP